MPNLDLSSNYTRGEIFGLDNHVIYSIIDPSPYRIPHGTFLELGVSDEYEFYKLRDYYEEKDLSMVMMKFVTVKGRKYKECYLAESLYPQKGYCSTLYKYIIRTSTLPIISHSRNTLPGSVNLWKHLRFKWQKSNVTVGYFDENTAKVYQWNRTTKEYKIWGVVNEYFVLEGDITPIEVLEDMKELGSINSDLYEFVKRNFDKIRDRSHIRLYAFHQ